MEQNSLKSLMNPSAFPVATRSVELLQTHVSWIFLTDSHVFKLKKPVNFGFLNFSTLELRHFYCNEEVRLNRRLCPEIYDGVVALHQTEDGPSFNGDGTIIDYAVMMKRLPAGRMLNILVSNGSVTVEDMVRLAGVISRFHAAAATSRHISGFGSLKQIRSNWTENLQQMLPFENTTLPAGERQAIETWVDSFMTANRGLFQRRIKEGHIRECDGDLHLENICQVNDSFHIFDCIEFNERFRFCDTAADLAFLLMDLDFHNRSDLSQAVLTAYLEYSADSQPDELTTFYKVYRAFVRGKVESLRLGDNGFDEQQKSIAKQQAIRYFRLARGYCERSGLRPTLFITCGTMGCGKSTLAGQLSFELGIPLHASDLVRKTLVGHPLAKAAREPYATGLYSAAMTEATYAELFKLASHELESGRTVLIDASFARAADRAAFARLAAHHQAEFVILMVSCSWELQNSRLKQRAESGISVSDGRIELLEQQTAGFEFPADCEGQIIRIEAADSPERLTSQIYGELRR